MLDKTVVKGLSRQEFLQALETSGLLTREQVASFDDKHAGLMVPELEQALLDAGTLTPFQCDALVQGRGDSLVVGNYEVLDRLGAGGMGTVFKARHRRMKRVVALKVLARELSSDPNFVHRFQREVETIARLSHPNIVMAYDADEDKVGHFLVMEFVDGRDLASLVANQGPLDVRTAVDRTLQAARGLGYAHQQGIVHRDIKPANLLVDAHGVLKVTDLGLARISAAAAAGQETTDSSLTKVGGIMGTADFMPPEQAMDATSADRRADIYSLGCTLHFLLLGQAPYSGGNLMATLVKHREAPIPVLSKARPGAPAALDEVFARMVAKQASDRFPSMNEVIEGLEAVLASLGGNVGGDVGGNAGMPASHLVSPQPPSGSSSSSTASARRTLDVVLVEPSRTQAGIIRKYLQTLAATIQVSVVASGKEAAKLLETHQPDAVVCTMYLDDMTGDELAAQVRASHPNWPAGFVLICAQADGDAQKASMPSELGVILRKPFSAAELAQAIKASSQALAWLPVPSGVSAGPPSIATGNRKDRSKMRVLIVDDSAAARLHERSVLQSLGFQDFAEATDGAQAIAVASREAFDLIVTDYNMPLLDGRGLIEFLKHNPSTVAVPVIMVTTETDPSKLEAVRALGVLAICAKSFSADDVRRILAPAF